MTAIKNFRRDCYQGLTSAARFAHRSADQGSLTTEGTGDLDAMFLWLSYSAFLCVPVVKDSLRFRIEVHCLNRQIPVRVENLEAALLLALKRILVRIHLLLQRGLIEWFISHGSILEDNGHAEIPAAVFSGVVPWLVHPNLGDAPHLGFFFQNRIVVLLEQLQKLVGMAPLRFVVVLDYEGPVGRNGGGLRMRSNWN